MDYIIGATGYECLIPNVVRGENCYIYTNDGKRYIDLESGVWCTNIGHGNPEINSLIKSQLNKIAHTGFFYANPIITKAAAKILKTVNFPNGKCEFLSSGSEAVEYGLRVADTISHKPLKLTLSDSYFGAYGNAYEKGNDWVLYDWLSCKCSHDGICNGDCDSFKAIPFNDIGVFLFEPGSSSGLVRFPPKMVIQKLAEATQKKGGIIMANEVTTGIGRTGKWFGYQHYDLSPDIVILGKGIGNGYPVSVVTINKRVADLLKNETFWYSQSHQNDPLGAAVALKVLEVVERESLLERSTFLGKLIMERLQNLKSKNAIIKEVRGRGLMFVIELYDKAEQVHGMLLREGFITVKRSGSEIIRIDPPLTISEKDIDSFLTSLELGITKVGQ